LTVILTTTMALAAPASATATSVTLTADTLTPVLGTSATLSAETDGRVDGDQWLVIMDETAGRLVSGQNYVWGSRILIGADQLLTGAHTYRAYIATLNNAGQMLTVIASSETVTLSTPGYSVSLEITGHDAGYTVVEALANSPVWGDYYLVVRDLLTGANVYVGNYVYGYQLRLAGGAGGAGGVRVLRAYVTTDPAYLTGTVATSDAVVVTDPNYSTAEGLVDAPAVTALVTSLAVKYPVAEEACLVYGQMLKTNALRSTAPDATLLCNVSGLKAAVRFMAALSAGAGTAAALLALYDAQSDTATVVPDDPCANYDDDGYCLDDIGEPRPDTEPAPEPDADSGAIKPPANCIQDLWARQELEDSMPEQYHHMATKYGVWGQRFTAIASRYGLSVSDSARAWNVFLIPHLGPHPAGYHQWVLDNMNEASRVAGTDKDEFLRLFNEWVVDVVEADPTIVRKAYWECYPTTPTPTPTPSPTSTS
jgi:hypothetical protein